jgi:hypothetical protein
VGSTRQSDLRRRLYGAAQAVEKEASRLFPYVLCGHPVFGSQAATLCGLEFFGADHVLFGSDSPFDPEKGSAYIRWTIEIIDGLPIKEEERHAILEGNARRLLKLK